MPVAVVLCLPVREDDRGAFVLLGLKKTGFGRGRIVGPGGKIDPGESPEQAAARELEEETTLVVSPGDLEDAATIRFRFPASPASDMDCTVFIARGAAGEAAETDELAPRWYPVLGLPIESMWDDSARWLPEILAGGRLDATVVLAEDNQSVADYSFVARSAADGAAGADGRTNWARRPGCRAMRGVRPASPAGETGRTP